ncbi:hypothetical protein ACJW8F_16645 [Plesiomonas shigelloides]|uniref:hypothetical protein n=1 Tax=Plesiomonas shigelloides TaxID=703 RepID=UPI00387EF8BA
MVDLRDILKDIDLLAIVHSNDKLFECEFFLNLLMAEKCKDKFRWLLGAFLNSCYGYLDAKVKHCSYRFVDENSGDAVPDQIALDILSEYVTMSRDRRHIKARARHPLLRKLYKLRNISTHDGGLGVMQKGNNLPSDYKTGYIISEGEPALEFCQNVFNLLKEINSRIDD